MRKVLSLILVLLMVFVVFSACANSDSTAEKESSPGEATMDEGTVDENTQDESTMPAGEEGTYRIGISCCLLQNEFFAGQIDAYYKIVEEKYPNIEIVSVLDANLDLNADLDNIAVFVSQGVDLIIISMSDFNSAEEILEAAGDIPVVITNRGPSDPEAILEVGKQSYVASSETGMATAVAEYLLSQIKVDGLTEINWANLQSDTDSQNSVQRSDAYIAAFEASDLPTKCVLTQPCSWSRTEGLSVTETLLGTGTKVHCIVAGNDEIALGAIEALKAANVDMTNVYVGSIDGVAASIESVANGEMDCTCLQPAYEQAETALASAWKILHGEETQVWYETSYSLITPENVANFR